eukprot:4930382-Pyramimonas_sp.AAC.1
MVARRAEAHRPVRSSNEMPSSPCMHLARRGRRSEMNQRSNGNSGRRTLRWTELLLQRPRGWWAHARRKW